MFKKSALKDVGFKYRESGLLVQAIKALGREHVDQKVLEHVSLHLESNACDRILKDARSVTGWIYEAIKRICRESD